MEHFTPIASALGGALIGLSTFLVLFFQARIAGISGIAGSLFQPKKGDIGWRVAFMLGMVGAGTLLSTIQPQLFGVATVPPFALVVAGFAVGLGTRMANGCTSGHGVCGLSRLSRRSMIATGVFMGTGALTVFIVNVFQGGA